MNAYVTLHVHVLIIVYFMFYSFVPSPGVWIAIKTLNIAHGENHRPWASNW